MPELFDAINAWLTHQPVLLAQMRWLFCFRSMVLFLLMGWFLWLIHVEDRKQPRSNCRRDKCPWWKA